MTLSCLLVFLALAPQVVSPQPQLTLENVSMITQGMTQRQVEGLLRAPGHYDWYITMGYDMSWGKHSGTALLSIQFQGESGKGKVVDGWFWVGERLVVRFRKPQEPASITGSPMFLFSSGHGNEALQERYRQVLWD